MKQPLTETRTFQRLINSLRERDARIRAARKVVLEASIDHLLKDRLLQLLTLATPAPVKR